MNFNEFQNLSKRTMPETGTHEDWRMAAANYALGLNGESGELGDMVKKEVFHGHNVSTEEIIKETGDVLHYLAGLATLYSFTLEYAAEKNIEKLKKRYPDGFNVEDSIKRVDVND